MTKRVYSSATVIALLNDAVGESGSAALVEAYGGQRIEIPTTVMGRLLEKLSPEVVAVLVDQYGGTQLDVPSWGHAERIQKSLRLKNDILTSGLTANEIAAKHGVTSIWVRKLRSDLVPAT